MGGFLGIVHPNKSTMIHKVPIPNPFYDNYRFVSHTWGWSAKYKLIQRSQKVFVDIFIFHPIFMLL